METFTINITLKVEAETFEEAMQQTEGDFYSYIESVCDESGEMVWSRNRRNMMCDLFWAVNNVVDVPNHFETEHELAAWVAALNVAPASAPRGSHYIEVPDELITEMRSRLGHLPSIPDDLLIRGICSPRVMTAAFEHVIGSTVRDACGPAQEILDTITIESILNAG